MDDVMMPRLQPVLAVLVCGHRAKRMGLEDETVRTGLEQALRRVLDDALAGAKAAFGRAATGQVHDRYARAAGRLRVLTGSMDGADAIARDVMAGMHEAEHVVIGLRGQADMGSGPVRACIGFNVPAAPEGDHAQAPGGDHAQAQTMVETLAQAARDELALAHADVLVALWDGKPSTHGGGGTVRLVHAAARARKPVIWIEVGAAVPKLHLLRRSTLRNQQLAALMGPEDAADSIQACFCPYDVHHFEEELDIQLVPWLGRSGRTTRHDAARDTLDDIFAGRLPTERKLERAGALDDMIWSTIGGDWRRARRAFHRWRFGDPEARMEEGDELFLWSDAMARVAAERHRLSVWAINVAAVLAVLLAVAGSSVLPDAAAHGVAGPSGRREVIAGILSVAEFCCLGGILAFIAWAAPRRVQRRWLFCRVVAEQMRVHAVLERLLGIAPAALRCPWQSDLHSMHLQDASAWLVHRWLVGTGFLPEGRELVPGQESEALALFKDQSSWMRGRHRSLARQERNMERAAKVLIWVALGAVVLHLFGVHVWWVLLWTAVFPALGAAVSNILTLAEVSRVADSYERTGQRLDELTAAMEEHVRKRDDADDPQSKWRHMMQVRRIAIEAGVVLTEENQVWRDLLALRVPAPP